MNLPVFRVFPPDVRETQKVKYLRLTVASLLPIRGCVPPELDQACLVRVLLDPQIEGIVQVDVCQQR
jgi:hypothetical protein